MHEITFLLNIPELESVSKITNFSPDGKKWARKNIFEIPPCGSHFLLIISYLLGKSEISFLPYILDLIHLLEHKFCPDSNLRVKTMYESVK